MPISKIEDIITDIRDGKMVILMDDEGRENEGDIIVAAEKVTPQIINFMASEARGLICLPMSEQRCDFLGLPSMVKGNDSKFSTPFTVSIEAAEGVTTGISAADRARTILAAVNPDGEPQDIVQPGHIFPLRAQNGGVLSRAGHTEAGCDLARLAGLNPAAAIVEIMNDDGTMARLPDLEVFAEKHDLKIGTIADLIHYRMANERTVEHVASKTVATEFGEFELHTFKDTIQNDTHIAMTLGDIKSQPDTLVRVQTKDTLRDSLAIKLENSQSWSSQNSLKRIAEHGHGVLIMLAANRSDEFQTNLERYFNPTERRSGGNPSGAFLTIGTGSQILSQLGVSKMRLLSSPTHYKALSGFDLEVVEYIPYQPNL